MKSNKLIAYAMDFASYLLQNMEDRHKIDGIILFGSVAREENTAESDVDIFIDTKNRAMENEAEKILAEFYKSIKITKYWNLLGIKNDINLKVGELDKWDIKDSIISNGIVLYGKYISNAESRPYTLFELKIKGKRKDKIKVWRQLYGYKQKVNGKEYLNEGLIKTYKGIKFGKATFIIPAEHTPVIKKYLKDNKVAYLIYSIGLTT